MSRTNPDLFEFFGKRRGRPTTSARAVSSPVARDVAVMAMSRRQAVLLGAGAALMIALAFVGGLAVGRGQRLKDGVELVGRPKPVEPTRDTWMLRGRALPRIALGNSENLEQRALAAIRERYPTLAPFLSSGPVEEGRGKLMNGQFRLILIRFADEASATAWAKALSAERVGEYYPFKDCRPEKAPR